MTRTSRGCLGVYSAAFEAVTWAVLVPITLARIAVETRNRVFAEASREDGDTNWGLGCRAHERLGHALGRLADSAEHAWLTVHRDGLYLMPLVDGIAGRNLRSVRRFWKLVAQRRQKPRVSTT